MSTSTKVRQPVPRVPPMPSRTRNTAHLPGEFPFTEIPKSGPVELPENTHTKEKKMSTASKIKALYSANKETIKRKAVVGVGAGIGMAIATGVAASIRAHRTNVIVVHESTSYYDDIESAPMAASTDFDGLTDTPVIS